MQFRRLPTLGGTPRQIAEILNNAMDGKTNNTGTVTLETSNATSTTINDERISVDTKIVLLPFSSAAFVDAAPFGEFTNNTDQTAPSTGSSTLIEWDTTEQSSGVYLSDDTRINIRNPGTYCAQYSLQLANIANAGEYADIWFRKNGTNIVDTGKRYFLPARKSASKPSHVVGAYETLVVCSAGDYLEVAGSVSNTDVSLEHFAADAGVPRPAIPAASIVVKLVSPLAYSNIFVSSQSAGQATISHYANDTADKTYAYILVG